MLIFHVYVQEKCDLMSDYIRRLKDCIKWFQHLEANYVSEHEKLKDLLEVAEKKCSDMGMIGSFLCISFRNFDDSNCSLTICFISL